MSHNYMGSYGSGGFGADHHAEEEVYDDDLEHEDPRLSEWEKANIAKWARLVLKMLREFDQSSQAMPLGDLAGDLRTEHYLRGPVIDAVLKFLSDNRQASRISHEGQVWVQAYTTSASQTQSTDVRSRGQPASSAYYTQDAGGQTQRPPVTQPITQPPYPYEPQPIYDFAVAHHGVPSVQRQVGFQPVVNQSRSQPWESQSRPYSYGDNTSGQTYAPAYGQSASRNQQSGSRRGVPEATGQYGHWA